MTTKDVADSLVAICRQGKIEDAQKELFAEDAVSIEPNDSMGPRETKGLEAIKKKGEMFNSMMENFYGATISKPVAQMKGHERMMMSEICVYKVKDGKVISEQFFF